MKSKKILSIALTLAMVLVLVASMNVTVFAAGTSMELSGDDTYSDSKSFIQKYTLVSIEGITTGATKVKIDWTLSDITVTRKDATVWDPETLTWVDDDDNDEVEVTQTGSAKFVITNLSSEKIDVAVSFETSKYDATHSFTTPTVTYDATTGTDGKVVVDTANGNNKYSASNPPKATIDVTIEPAEEDFTTLATTSEATQYGTYIVTIATSTK